MAAALLLKCRRLLLAPLRLRCSAIGAFKHQRFAQRGCFLPARDTLRQGGSVPVAPGCISPVFRYVGFPCFLLDASVDFALWQFPARRVVLLSRAADRAPATSKAASLPAVVAAARAFKA
ncbi:uncharacterized protein CDV56_104165 [Aspergillus thermomutatus]|uniref:Uncharacterized protein n=1 Tax=Aspergillus thermomutatus TaxID=41047 RepID=A0A397GBH9_ASPTH|nr:uncharacterized protein CDV56_104165 [Aspergillus thermomutatus]RHZ48375.1 hypothetical protein CDV56_104165 [Aspergillus thermomutatus]